ncbi:hypothetical protein M422DRAFT_53876 [Sphaerobolus stellatus SS14]|uniref:Extracellular membrane protein CFEM domain-containing protein n=1 Tax=Sphaerobolus stellatus (strain SS14) TaxID=990650 RepID=A0A0C9UYH1_SPHS4|nr:hypothetical protein M422DRAFT_53876 [Sphaerobolus stellatus SS14]
MHAVMLTVAIVALSQARMALASTSGGLSVLLGRQSPPSVPPECQGNCTMPLNTEQTCGNPPQPNCLCSVDLENSYFDCLLCLGQVLNTTDYTSSQGIIDQLTTECDDFGIPLEKLTFPGQDPDRTLSTSTANATSTSASQGSQTAQASTTPPLQTVPTSLPPRTGTSTSPQSTQTTKSNGALGANPRNGLGVVSLGCFVGLMFAYIAI